MGHDLWIDHPDFDECGQTKSEFSSLTDAEANKKAKVELRQQFPGKTLTEIHGVALAMGPPHDRVGNHSLDISDVDFDIGPTDELDALMLSDDA